MNLVSNLSMKEMPV